MAAPIVNSFRLLSGKHSRWVGDHRERHVAGTDSDIIHNLTETEMEVLKGRIERLDPVQPAAPSPKAAKIAAVPPVPAPVSTPAPAPEPVVETAEPVLEPAASQPDPKSKSKAKSKPAAPKENAPDIDWPTILSNNSAAVLTDLINEQTDPVVLRAVEKLEQKDRNRVTVLRVVRARLQSLAT